MPKFVVVDGSSYLYRAFHALPDLRTSRGEPTGAIRGVISMLRRLVEDGKPDYFAVVFDAPGKTFRDEWYPEYKANRAPMPDDLVRQIAPLHELIRVHGWPLIMVDGVEADDVIATLVRKAEARHMDSIVSTGDKDLAQLISPRITLVNTMSNEILDEQSVVAKFGVRADQILDLLTLTGDAVDNVPGVPKVGPKTAAKWLTQYDTLDNIVAHAAEIGGVVGENLRATLGWLPQGRKLLTVKTDCALPFEPTDLAPQPVEPAKLKELFERFEFKTWAKDVGGGEASARNAGPKAATPAGAVAEPSVARAQVPRHYELVTDEAAFERWVAAITRARLV
jgi:DNA polymerase-1